SAQYVTIPDAKFASYLSTVVPSAMNGNQMDTTSPVVISLTRISVENKGIADLTGIQYFTSLTALDCGNTYPITDTNKITALKHLPATLDSLICRSNRLQSIDSLPGALTYFVCSNNTLAIMPSFPAGLIYIDCSGNGVLDSLPALPGVLTILNCENDGLIRLPVLPNSLVSLECDINKLDSLPILPASLTSLSCSNNALTGLPVLPASLTYLCCYANQITSLSPLPNGLITLICGNNKLTALPTLPGSLQLLKCYANQIPVLPVLPNSLNYIDCSYNLLQNLPVLPGSLGTLICSANKLANLPTLPVSLSYLDCRSNQLTVLPALPASLNTLYCGTNQFAVLPTLPPNLLFLECSQNGITALPALPPSLGSLICEGNLFSKLPALPGSLALLDCAYNMLSSGLPALPNSISILNCSFDSLTSLPALPDSLHSFACVNNYISCFPAFPLSLNDTGSFNIYGNLFHCLPNYVHAMDRITLSYPLCGIGNVNGCPNANGIVGFTFRDMDGNCKKDSGDLNLVNIPMSIYNNNNKWLGQTYTASNGVYDFPDSLGTYKIVADTVQMPFVVQCAHPGDDSVVSVNGIDTNVNFSFTCKSGFDVGVQSVITNGLVFPASVHGLRVLAGDMSQWYNLECAKGDSGTVQITFWGPVTYAGVVTGALVPVVTGNVLTYTIADFGAVNNKTAFQVLLNTDTNAKAGDSICVNVSVSPHADNNPGNNSYHYCYPVVNSHDPNAKTVYPVKVVKGYKGWFIYTVYFQNTGTAAAKNILLTDTLDKRLDPTTFELINYSHPNTVQLKGNVLNVNFPNINLPDSAADAKASIGFIQYRIKPKVAMNFKDSIHNTGYIYFDYNAPIVTNTTVNKVVEVITSVNNMQVEGQANIFPNPNNGSFCVVIRNYELRATNNVEVYNMIGELIYTARLKSANTQIDLTKNGAGIYFYRVITETGGLVSEGKLVIQK
ncbi:MAG TPA: T9SS type A sorting domain-containing protein, partial [Bacteroidia bacterium]|nr:T9SS type A sorting domain-containing protein [Bacteroidia bacterium]